MREPTPHHVKQTPTASFVANGSRHPPLAAAAIDTADDGMAPQVHELTAATKAEATRSPRARPHARQESPPAGRQAYAVDNELPEAPASDAGLPSAAAGSTTRNSAAVELCLEVTAPDKRPGSGASPGLNCHGAAFPNDDRLRKTYRTHVNVRNFTAGNIFPGNAMP